MKNLLSKATACMLFALMMLSASAQVAQSAQPAPVKSNGEQIKDMQIKKAAALVENIATSVKISDEQKAKLQASLLEAVIKSDEARSAIKGDDTKLKAWKDAKVADITARIKVILTPAQFGQVMKDNNAN